MPVWLVFVCSVLATCVWFPLVLQHMLLWLAPVCSGFCHHTHMLQCIPRKKSSLSLLFRGTHCRFVALESKLLFHGIHFRFVGVCGLYCQCSESVWITMSDIESLTSARCCTRWSLNVMYQADVYQSFEKYYNCSLCSPLFNGNWSLLKVNIIWCITIPAQISMPQILLNNPKEFWNLCWDVLWEWRIHQGQTS